MIHIYNDNVYTVVYSVMYKWMRYLQCIHWCIGVAALSQTEPLMLEQVMESSSNWQSFDGSNALGVCCNINKSTILTSTILSKVWWCTLLANPFRLKSSTEDVILSQVNHEYWGKSYGDDDMLISWWCLIHYIDGALYDDEVAYLEVMMKVCYIVHNWSLIKII